MVQSRLESEQQLPRRFGCPERTKRSGQSSGKFHLSGDGTEDPKAPSTVDI
ncbi:MAG: hypothetical protein JXA30_18600 [Deltaproteobacteria bacterium]|nr:hypothetical protein [Deltaproteobacteria bacterium]